MRWLKKHVNIPFIAEKGHDESHVNGCSGTFSVNKNGRDYPVTYTILHLHTKDQALRAMFAMQAEQSKQTYQAGYPEKKSCRYIPVWWEITMSASNR